MAIGTAQPTKKQMDTVKHHLIGCLEPEEFISSGKYASLVKEKIDDVVSQNKNPIICGGSGLYYRAIQKGIFEGSISNLKIRKKLELQYAKNPKLLFNKLKSIDKSKIEKGANSFVKKMLLTGIFLLIIIALTEIFIK